MDTSIAGQFELYRTPSKAERAIEEDPYMTCP
jgi:hypothetical protein